jgi:serine/threonine kinase PknH
MLPDGSVNTLSSHRSCRFAPVPEESAMGLFISYSSQDRSAIEPLTAALRRARQQVWFDDDLGGGEAWWNEILEQIRACDVFIVALSNRSLESKPCQAEWRYAKALDRPILPVRIGPVGSMRANPLAALQVIEYENPTVDAGIQLVTAVHGLAAQQRPLPSPLPEEPPVPFAYLMRLSSTLAEQNLDPHQQTHLVTELKSGLEEDGDDPTARNDIARLLRMLRDRSDVTYRTRTEIDELLASVDVKSAAPQAAPDVPRPQHEHPVARPTTPAALAATPPETPKATPPRPTRSTSPPAEDTRPSSKRWLIAGAAGLAVIVAIVAAVLFATQKPSPKASSNPTAPAAGPTPSINLDSILLGAADINAVMGVSNMQPINQLEQMAVPPGTPSNPNCLGALSAIQGSIYQGSGYSAVRGQGLNAEDPPHFVYEAAVSFPSAQLAHAFVRTSADKWQACVGPTLTMTTQPNNKTFHWNFENVAGSPPKITQIHRQATGQRTCQHALSAVSHVVIDVVACGEQGITDQGSRIADQIASKVTP